MQTSAGLLPFRRVDGSVQVLIAHPGGPFFARKHEGAWSVVKGLIEAGEAPLEAAQREFSEETGWNVPADVDLVDLGDVRLTSGKVVIAWGFEGEFDPEQLQPGMFEMEWRGVTRTYPEIDKVVWASPEQAQTLLNPAQAAFVERLIDRLPHLTTGE